MPERGFPNNWLGPTPNPNPKLRLKSQELQTESLVAQKKSSNAMATTDADPHTTPRRHREGEALQQYYIAVDRQPYKMVATHRSLDSCLDTWVMMYLCYKETLVDLLTLLGRSASLPVAICCSSRDSLDAVCARVTASQQFSLAFLHSDQGDTERADSLNYFHSVVADWNQRSSKSSEPNLESTVDENTPLKKSGLLVMTDACLPTTALGEASLGARVVIHYDLPAKKEAYIRRMVACLATGPIVLGGSNFGGVSGGIVISVVVGGEVGVLSSIEEGCGIIIDEMPIHIAELL